MDRDGKFEEVNVQLMASELDRVLEKYKSVLSWNDRLEAAGLVSKHYGAKLTALDKLFAHIIPKYPELLADPEVIALFNRFADFGDRYNKGTRAGEPFDVHSFQGASLNEMRLLVRNIIGGV